MTKNRTFDVFCILFGECVSAKFLPASCLLFLCVFEMTQSTCKAKLCYLQISEHAQLRLPHISKLVWPLLFSLFQSGSDTTAHLYAQTVCNEISAGNKWQTMHLGPVSRAVHKRPLCLPNSLALLRARARTPHTVS